jgi:hypothetical protein
MNFQKRKKQVAGCLFSYNKTFNDLVLMQLDIHIKMGFFNFATGNTNENLPTGLKVFPRTNVDYDRVNIGLLEDLRISMINIINFII